MRYFPHDADHQEEVSVPYSTRIAIATLYLRYRAARKAYRSHPSDSFFQRQNEAWNALYAVVSSVRDNTLLCPSVEVARMVERIPAARKALSEKRSIDIKARLEAVRAMIANDRPDTTTACGDLDGLAVPNHLDHSKRCFSPQ